MLRGMVKLSMIFIFIVMLTMGCENEDLISTTPPSPINMEDAILFNPDLAYGFVIDIDGNIYKTIKIGDKTWMAENLRVTRFRNGDIIPTIASATTWNKMNEWGVLGLCAYNNDYKKESIARYGLLYGYLVPRDERQVAPVGWHVATDGEWYELLRSVPIASLIGIQWNDYASFSETDKANINKTGFTLLPSGYRYGDGSFTGRGFDFYNDSYFNIYWDGHFMFFIGNGSNDMSWEKAFSLRCVKD